MDRLLEGRDYFCGDFSTVDIAHFGWVNTAVASFYPVAGYPNLGAWFERMSARPAVAKGITIPAPLIDFAPLREGAVA
ncbi:MAG: glutathione binding-like protein [Sphingomonas sp.]|jgi:glutathione S-transferase|uniref:glutathione S-transferase family protein n=1 Tax=Sphingomonas sp. TaxID=28214 RepID=UPI00356B5E88